MKQVNKTSYKVKKTTLSTLHQQLYLDFSQATFDITIAGAPISFTATAQEIAKICQLVIAGNVKIQRYTLF